MGTLLLDGFFDFWDALFLLSPYALILPSLLLDSVCIALRM